MFIFNEKKHILLGTIVALMCVCGLCGCSRPLSNDEDNNSSSAQDINVDSVNIVKVYYVSNGKIVAEDDQYQIKQPDSVMAAAEELMNQAAEHFDSNVLEYKSYMIDEDNNLDIEFVQNGEVSKEELFLTKAAFLNTIFQIENIGQVKIILEDGNKKIVDTDIYSKDSLYFYDYDKKPYERKE